MEQVKPIKVLAYSTPSSKGKLELLVFEYDGMQEIGRGVW